MTTGQGTLLISVLTFGAIQLLRIGMILQAMLEEMRKKKS
jgi:hypothetical protein